MFLNTEEDIDQSFQPLVIKLKNLALSICLEWLTGLFKKKKKALKIPLSKLNW